MSHCPIPLPENSDLAFVGEAAWEPALITDQQAEQLAATRNPTGRPNSDVLRSYVGKTKNRVCARWQIDFPAHYREQEAALYQKPFTWLEKKVVTKSGSWWVNPRARPPLRHALARLDRFLATALDSPQPSWFWCESEHLPDASLLVVARDDDFTHAVLQSAPFALWWHAHFRSEAPTEAIASFPFPWPPAAPLGSLTKVQQDARSSAARAVIAGENEQLNTAVAAAYGWRSNWDENAMLPALSLIHESRGGAH